MAVIDQSTTSLKDQFEQQGFAVAPGRFSAEEVERFKQYFMDMIHRGGDGWAETPVDPDSEDPLGRYPRLLQPHRGDDVAFGFMVDPRVREDLAAILGKDPYAVQTMVYFKPPGARGQALHQDQRYLRVEPGTCMAAWLALDDCDEENGCMEVVPGSHGLPVLCPHSSDSADSWTHDEVPVPPGYQSVPAIMKAGDVLYFNGQLIHGSHKNTSKTRFRRTLIAHYIEGDAEKVAHYYFPIFNMDGSTLEDGVESNPWGGGPCGYIRGEGPDFTIEEVGEVDGAKSAH